MSKMSARSSFGKINGKAGGIVASISRFITKTPALICLLGLLVLMLVMFKSTGDLGGFRQHVTRLQEVEEEEEEPQFTRSSLSNHTDNSLRSLKELVKEAMDKGLVIIVNASKADADRLYADNPRGALPQWDVNAALDGPTGEILTEVIQELHHVEELQKEVATLRAIQNKCATTQNQADEACTTMKLKMHLDESKTPGQNVSAAESAGPIFQGDYKFRPIQSSLPPLILFSSYRMSHEEFVLVTLVANSFGEKMLVQEATTGTCIWMQWDPSSNQSTPPPPFPPPEGSVHNQMPVQQGKKSYTFISDPAKGGLPYDVAIIKCSFEDPTGSNGFGGHLYLKLSTGEFIPVFDEPPEAINRIQFEGALKNSYAFCPPVIWEPLNVRYLKQWLMFNNYVFREGKLHYFIYHGIEFDSATMSVLQPFLDKGLLTFIDMRLNESFAVAPGQYPSLHLAMNDCLQRSRFFANWAFFWGFDEYLEILSPNTTLLGLLGSNKESPYITFRSQVWSTIYCSSLKNATINTADEDWAVERMFLRLEHPEGSQKWAANPVKVFAGTVHYTMEPSWGGVALDTGIARLNLYRSEDSKGPVDVDSDKGNCRVLLDPNKVNASTAVDRFWWRDTSVSANSRHAHDLAKASPLFSFSFPISSNTTTAAEDKDHTQNVTQ